MADIGWGMLLAAPVEGPAVGIIVERDVTGGSVENVGTRERDTAGGITLPRPVIGNSCASGACLLYPAHARLIEVCYGEAPTPTVGIPPIGPGQHATNSRQYTHPPGATHPASREQPAQRPGATRPASRGNTPRVQGQHARVQGQHAQHPGATHPAPPSTRATFQCSSSRCCWLFFVLFLCCC